MSESRTYDHNSLRDLFENLYRPHRLRHKTKKTVYRYRLEIDRFERFLKRPATIADLTDVTVGDAAEWVLSPEGAGLGVESTRGFQGRICRVWEFLARKRIADEFPTLENMRRVKRIPLAWRRDELKILWQALSRLKGDIDGIPESDWFCSLIVTMWRTSERPGAMLQIESSDVDLRGGWLVINGEKRKGGIQSRAYRLTLDCIEWIRRIYDPTRKYVWPWPHHYTYLYPRFKEILRCAGLPFGRDRMFGCIRKSHASHLKAAGGDATKSLGHSGSAVTDEYYLDPRITEESRESPSDLLFGLDGEDPPRVA